MTTRVRARAPVAGVHDYSVHATDPRADPSALLLHHAAVWWTDSRRRQSAAVTASQSSQLPPIGESWNDDVPAEPLWLNDGPVPTEGLLKYKSQYHMGKLLHVLSLRRNDGGMRARARWALLLKWHRKTRRRHVGVRSIRSAAQRIYGAAPNHHARRSAS